MKKLIIQFTFLLFSNSFIGQNKIEIIDYINTFEKKLDTINKMIEIGIIENEKQAEIIKKQRTELDNYNKDIELKKQEITKLNSSISEKTNFIDTQEKFITIFIILGVISVFFLSLLIINILEKKKINKNLEYKNTQIKLNLNELKIKNKEITDSITYAKRIQEAILPKSKIIKKLFEQSFILFKPKDIISGDFYWVTENKNQRFFVTADCTGHGVPGALMSVLGMSLLNDIINKKNIVEPNEILNELRTSIINSLEKTDNHFVLKDGMDIVVYSIDKTNTTLKYAAANNGIYIIRANEIIKLNIDKIPVGAGPKENIPFKNYSFNLNKDDIIITYTDGFADQFGGPKGKKFKYKQLQELLVVINQKNKFDDFPNYLDDIFYKWKGKLEQIDDVLLVGIKI